MLSTIEKHNGVYYITEKQDVFSSIYIDVRKKEQRIYPDKIVESLPEIKANHKYYQEWKLRQKSTNRIINYLTDKNKPLKILDIGCGNGWFSNQLSSISNSKIFAIDVNEIELEQGARVFKKPNLKFIYADIFSVETNILEDFDIITVNSCIQYFENLEEILSCLKNKLKPDGELHIIDSPFYKASEIAAAKKRTKNYYKSIGVPDMAAHYFHHTIEDIPEITIMHKPDNSLFSKLVKKKDSPFMWLKQTNNSL